MVSHLHFEIPQVRVDNSVWMWLAKEKLDTFKLSTDAVLNRLYVNFEACGATSRIVVSQPDPHAGTLDNTLMNTNTAKEFREMDRKNVFNPLLNMSIELQSVPRLYLMSFADLKTYVFTYNVALPTLNPEGYDFEYAELVRHACAPGVDEGRRLQILKPSGESLDFNPSLVASGDGIIVHDVNLGSEAGLPFYVRSVLTSIAQATTADLLISVCLKSKEADLEFKGVLIKPTKQVRIVPNWVRWTNPTTQQPTAIQSVDLKRYMDPSAMAAESVALNIKLIKWRLLPTLDPAKMSSLRFLLIGAGTLGCAVARCLISWGVEKITFVDSGRVSYSNPPRQWLFRLEDAASSAPKAATAALRLKEVLPSADIQGIELAVPLPGHPADIAQVEEAHAQLSDLVDNHDVVMMLTDSRESRWLPTLLVAARQATKPNPPLGLSVALGFDSYLIKAQSYMDTEASCYFCNDVNAPTDMTTFRTLDQQCTVTRPGIAAIASCTAVELVASLSQGGFAAKRTVQDESLLGSTPDQIRGFLGTFQSFTAVTEPFSNCICCSGAILDAYRREGIEFVKKVVMDSDVLMQTSGLSAFNTRAGAEDVIIFSEDDEGIGA